MKYDAQVSGRTLRSKKLRAALYYAQDGKCALCGCELGRDWEADHIVPWSIVQDTNVHAMQALCPRCNREKGANMLRKHQQEMKEIAATIRSGGNITNVLAHVTPGGGKSGIAMIVAKELAQPLRYKICWVVPRDSLRSQGEKDFSDPRKRNIFGHAIGLRASGNDINPSGDEGGCVVTYQAIAANPELWQHEFRRRPYILILDECHHVPDRGDSMDDDAAFFSSIAPLVRLAKLCIYTSGTLNRHDGHEIAFIPYTNYTNGKSPSRIDVPGWAFINYSRKDALEERAIVPLHFHVMDGKAQWYDERGAVRMVDSMTTAPAKDQSNVLRTALETRYANDLIDRCLKSWQEHKQGIYGKAKMLVIAPRQEIARSYLKHIRAKGVTALLAISDMDADARKNIDRFKGPVDVLVTVGMAYEGLDVPEITHVALLTNIRSAAWIEQAICRANRMANGKTHGYIYFPDDAKMNRIMEAIEREQAAVVVTYPPEVISRSNSGEGDGAKVGITPIASVLTDARGFGLEDGTRTDYAETSAIRAAMEQANIKGTSEIQFKQAMVYLGVAIEPNGLQDEPNYNENVLVSTPSQREEALKQTIDRQVKRLAKGDSERIQRINVELKRLFGPRGVAREQALRLIIAYVNEHQRELEAL